MDHEFRSSLTIFDEVGHPPPMVNATNIITHANTWSQWIASGGWHVEDDHARKIGLKWLSILFKLDYWNVQHINMGIPLVSC
jgi:hypothetical protein